MRIFKYWAAKSTVLEIGKKRQHSKVYGGSNISIENAIEDANRKLKNVQDIINGISYKDPEYEVDILEEVIETIDTYNIVTRNRYGALILNSKNLMFIDVDDYSPSLFELLFKKSKSSKDLMLQKIVKTTQKGIYASFGFRIYETHRGYRIMVTHKDFDPRSDQSIQIMKDFRADPMYRLLCFKQNCYRARLTPKPYRIRQKGIKVLFPDRTENEEKNLQDWTKQYQLKSQRFSVCNLVKVIGSTRTNRIIEYHDRLTGIKQNAKLA